MSKWLSEYFLNDTSAQYRTYMPTALHTINVSVVHFFQKGKEESWTLLNILHSLAWKAGGLSPDLDVLGIDPLIPPSSDTYGCVS